MKGQSVFSLVIIVLLIMQGFAIPGIACEMPSFNAKQISDTSSHDHHDMHASQTTEAQIETTHSMTMTGDCCGENCQCPKGTGFSNALLGKGFVGDLTASFQQAAAKQFGVLDAHRLSQFKPPIFA